MADDYERYGDYDDIEEDAPKGKKSPIALVLKALIALVCIGVVGIIAFRMIIFNNYPAAVKNVYFTDELKEYYAAHGTIGAKTQKLRAPYDDPDLGNFFCDHLIVVEGIDQLQITVRYNTGNISRMSDDLGLELDPDNADIFTFRLVDNYGRVYDDIGGRVFASQLMYRYTKLVFDGVDFSPELDAAPEWIRLEIFIAGMEGEEPYAMVPVYENNEVYSAFEAYELSEGEKPQ